MPGCLVEALIKSSRAGSIRSALFFFVCFFHCGVGYATAFYVARLSSLYCRQLVSKGATGVTNLEAGMGLEGVAGAVVGSFDVGGDSRGVMEGVEWTRASSGMVGTSGSGSARPFARPFALARGGGAEMGTETGLCGSPGAVTAAHLAGGCSPASIASFLFFDAFVLCSAPTSALAIFASNLFGSTKKRPIAVRCRARAARPRRCQRVHMSPVERH